MDEEYRLSVEAETKAYIDRLSKLATRPAAPKAPPGNLEEFIGVDQKEIHKGILRRWFQNSEMTLIVWYSLDRKIEGFQLCYGRPGSDRAISWYNDQESSHRIVDYGVVSSQTATLNKDAGRINFKIFEDFYSYATTIDNEVLAFVRQKEAILKSRSQREGDN